MKKYILLGGLLVSGAVAFAQQEFDALKYSLSDISGSARYVSMSGAFGALGGDMSTLGMNPAGIAVFRSSELSITPSLSTTSANSVFNNFESGDTRAKLQINNFGYIGSFRTYDESEISNFNFGISFNKIKDYNRNVSVLGDYHLSSLLDRICNDKNNGSSNLFDYANNTKVIGWNTASTTYEPILGLDENVTSDMYMKESGGVNEWNMSVGANYGHKFYFGMSLGIQSINYELSSVYYEGFEQGGGFELRNVLVTEGAGVNLKVGAIFRPVPELRLGLAYHSPTYYGLTDIYNASMASIEISNPDLKYEGVEGYTDYQLRTPSRLLYSMAYQIGNKGFLSLDWDVIDYRETALKSADGVPYGDTNSYMDEDFRVVSNLRLGAEYRLTDNVSLRGGTAWYQSPVKTSLEKNNTYVYTAGTTPQYGVVKDTYYLSCGLGYRTGGFFLDAALQNQFHNENFYNFYDGSSASTTYNKYSELKTNRTSIIVSTGFKF